MSKATTIRLSAEDRALIDQLKKQFGITSGTQVIRTALRVLAAQPVGSVVGITPPKTREDG